MKSHEEGKRRKKNYLEVTGERKRREGKQT